MHQVKNRALLACLALAVLLLAARALGGEASPASAAAAVPASAGNWGLSFQTEGAAPIGNATVEDLAQHRAYYLGDTGKKVIYLTFDCGYENGYTEQILDALKKHLPPPGYVQHLRSGRIPEGAGEPGRAVPADHRQAPVPFLPPAPREVQRAEPTAGPRHGLYHGVLEPGLCGLVCGQPAHPPAGKLLPRIHDGAIVLLHSTSRTNAEILDELLTKWEEMGYTFASLNELPGVR